MLSRTHHRYKNDVAARTYQFAAEHSDDKKKQVVLLVFQVNYFGLCMYFCSGNEHSSEQYE